MRRWIRRAIAVGSALLCLSLASFWIRSKWTDDQWEAYVGSRSGESYAWRFVQCISAEGQVYLTYEWNGRPLAVEPGTPSNENPVTDFLWDTPPRFLQSGMRVPTHLGFGAHPLSRAHGVTVAFPYWFVTMISGIVPMIILLQSLRRYRRGARGLCLTCGYDLRASPETCPECGSSAG